MFEIKEIRVEYLKSNTTTDNPKPRFSIIAENSEKGSYCTGYSISVVSNDELFWQTERVNTRQTVNILYSGKPLKAYSEYTVNVQLFDNNGNTAKGSTVFETAKMGDAWAAAWITHPTFKLKGRCNPPAFVFKRELKCTQAVKKIKLYVTAMGIYTIKFNGIRVGNDYLAPGYTSYKHNLLYQVYDVTEYATTDNTLVCTVAGGWACAQFGIIKSNKAFANKPALLCEMRVCYEDGSCQTIATDTDWQVSTDGPVRDASIYDGEIYDARKEDKQALFVNAGLAKMKVNPTISAENGVLPTVIKTLVPVSSHQGEKGVIYDFGQNFAGVVHISIKNAQEGQIINVRHAEVLMEGELYTRPLRSAKARFVYICKQGNQEYNPEYTYMGFRYIEVCGIAEDCCSISAFVLSSANEEQSFFRCSDQKINRLHENIKWGSTSNFVDIPTDCPQRNERLGWTGDIAVFASTACFNYNLTRFLEKWLTDVAAEQTKKGELPVVVPRVKFMKTTVTAGWGDCSVLVPWALYLSADDKSILEKFYPLMKNFLKGAERKSALFSYGYKKYIWSFGFSYGDWCAPNEGFIKWKLKKKWVSTAYFASSCNIMSQIAAILGKTEDEKYYSKLFRNICSAYRKEFTNGEGLLKNGFQTAYVCPLYFDMTEGKERAEYAANLAKSVRQTGHLSTGFLGTPYLLFALSDNGYVKEAFDLLYNEDCPGWLYEIKAGATTIWERWDALRPDGTVNFGAGGIGGGMVSFNHYANGAVGDWLYRRVAGIEQTEAGYACFRLQPHIDKRLSFVSCEKVTPYGVIKSSWKYAEGKFFYSVEIPFNTKAKVILPNGETFDVGSGCYFWEATDCA